MKKYIKKIKQQNLSVTLLGYLSMLFCKAIQLSHGTICKLLFSQSRFFSSLLLLKSETSGMGLQGAQILEK
jgi:hypothetical protein